MNLSIYLSIYLPNYLASYLPIYLSICIEKVTCLYTYIFISVILVSIYLYMLSRKDSQLLQLTMSESQR